MTWIWMMCAWENLSTTPTNLRMHVSASLQCPPPLQARVVEDSASVLLPEAFTPLVERVTNASLLSKVCMGVYGWVCMCGYVLVRVYGCLFVGVYVQG